MKKEYVFSLILIFILLITTLSLFVSYNQSSNCQNLQDPIYIGVAFGGETVTQAKLIIDRTKSYTNLFILNSGINPISKNQTAVKEICDYATNAGLNIIVNLGSYTRANWTWQVQFYNSSKVLYGAKFLGAYYDDEPGGIPLDWNWTKEFAENELLFESRGNPLDLTPIRLKLEVANQTGIPPQNYTIEAQWFNELLELNRGHNDLKRNNITTFTSDYVLYWFDYLGGYDTLFTQLGWNASAIEQIALLRGAATMQNKDWGAIITWQYTQPPYLDTGPNIYHQMKTAYNAGAKYITIFDYPYNLSDNPYGVMTDDHFQALEQFWNQVATKATQASARAQAALILPKDYGWGMRNPTDKIWGFWGPDDKSPIIWAAAQTLLRQYGSSLDIIYDDPAFPIKGNYSKVYYWNQKI